MDRPAPRAERGRRGAGLRPPWCRRTRCGASRESALRIGAGVPPRRARAASARPRSRPAAALTCDARLKPPMSARSPAADVTRIRATARRRRSATSTRAASRRAGRREARGSSSASTRSPARRPFAPRPQGRRSGRSRTPRSRAARGRCARRDAGAAHLLAVRRERDELADVARAAAVAADAGQLPSSRPTGSSPPKRAEWTPGRPPRPSTSRPESSPSIHASRSPTVAPETRLRARVVVVRVAVLRRILVARRAARCPTPAAPRAARGAFPRSCEQSFATRPN